MTFSGSEMVMKRSVVGHFRVSQDVYESLEGEARTQGISLNALVSQVLSSHARDDLLFQEGGFVKMTKNTLRVVLGLIPDDKLSEFGRLAAKNGADARMLARSHYITVGTVLDELRLFSRSGWYSMNEEKKNGNEIISLIHDLGPTTGPRQSVVLSAYITGLFALVGVRPKITTTSSSVMVEY
jgi:hypothetical protein